MLIEDVQQWYITQNQLSKEKSASSRNQENCIDGVDVNTYQTPINYKYGSMGGYLTYSELLATLEDMKNKYPTLISDKQEISGFSTANGYPIYWLKIGDQANEREPEPEILYTALHHAREPNSLSQMVFYMWYLLENYELDQMAKYLVDSTQLYFIPCVNPDGYIYNEEVAPEGGGLWRKNRRRNTLKREEDGVDLNRNYSVAWGINEEGSSSNPASELYRGAAPFSEPETQAIRAFCNEHNFKIALNYHTYSNLLIYSDKKVTSTDEAIYRAFGKELTRENNYFFGTDLETIGRPADGTSEDWMYGEQSTKEKILSFTPEVGPGDFGFWPPKSAIDGLNKANLWQNVSAAALLKSYGVIFDTETRSIDETDGKFNLVLQNIGLEKGEISVKLRSLNESVEVDDKPIVYELEPFQSEEISFSYHADLGTTFREVVLLETTISNGKFEKKQILSKQFSNQSFTRVFEDQANNIGNWKATGRWAATTEQFYSPNSSFTDSPNRNYADSQTSYFTLNKAIDLSNAESAILKYKAKWDIENGFDFVQIKIRPSTLSNFRAICGNYSKSINGEPLYTGLQADWIEEEIDISEYAGQEIYLQFQFSADQFINFDGFYFDDLSVESIPINATTSAAEAILENGTIILSPNPTGSQFQINFTLKEPLPIFEVQLINILGQEMERKQFQNMQKGAHTIDWNCENLAKGLYFLILKNGPNQYIKQKLIKGAN